MQIQTQQEFYSVEEYLDLEAIADYKSEYRDGEIIPMTGGSINHNRIIRNLSKLFDLGLEGQPFETFMSDLRLWISRYRLHTYPDLMVITGEPEFYQERRDTVTNPFLITEVLSKSTMNYDKGEKFDYYRSIPSLKEYILVDQYQVYVEHFSKTADNKWLLTEYESVEDCLVLSSLNLQIQLQKIYDRVEFETVEK
jgi:Uma2 family endonuclease